MIVEEVTPKEYAKLVQPKIFYNTNRFNELNKNKVDRVRYFLFRDTKYRFGLCVGMKGPKVAAPFSAPFASLSAVHNKWDICQVDEAIACLDAIAQTENWSSIQFILPPPIYEGNLVVAMQNALLRAGFHIAYQDLNYMLDLNRLRGTSYEKSLLPNGKKNLRIARNAELQFKHCIDDKEKELAYNTIAINRKAKGYPLRMTWENILATIQMVDHDFFLIIKNELTIAAAQVFHVCEDIAQVIYWGDVPSYPELKPVNYLAYKLTEYYQKKEFRYLDIGPSTENGIPNYGLCTFKSSIGCDISAKFTFKKIYNKAGASRCGI